MIYRAFTEINTPNLILRKLRLSDTCDFYEFASDEDVSKYMLWTPHESISDSEKSILSSLEKYEKGKYYRFGIALKDTDRLIGIIQLLSFDEEKESASFAYMLARDFWGLGYGTEALTAVINYAFEQLEIQMIEADHFTENVSSGAVMRKCGMSYVDTVKDKYEKNGRKYSADTYILTREDWKKRAAL